MIRFGSNSAIEFKQETVLFNGGELHPTLKVLTHAHNSVNIIAHLHNSAAIMELLLIKDAIDRLGKFNTTLTMPYVPYARQDRVANKGEAFGIKVFTDLINNAGFHRVVVSDPHSIVTEALINKVEVDSQIQTLTPLYMRKANSNDIIVAPDLGSVKKAELFAAQRQLPLIVATKHRDTRTGKLSDPKINLPEGMTLETINQRLSKGGSFIVLDDICDAGGTFLALGALLNGLISAQLNGRKGATLIVTHGIFANSAKERLSKYYDNVLAAYEW